MADDGHPTRRELLARLETLERQLLSQEDIQSLIQDLEIHQEEVRVQNAALFETQRELECSRDRYSDIYDFAPIGLVTLDVSGIVASVNLTAARLLATERARLLGMPLLIYVAEHDRRRFLDYLGRCRREEGEAPAIELELRGLGNPGVPVEIAGRRFRSGADATSVYNIAILDLRERRRAEAERLRAMFEQERLSAQEATLRLASEAKDRFLAVLSHELRTPLTPILLTLERLEQDVLDRSAMRVALDTIRRNLTVETRLIDDLLDITRIERDRLNLAEDAVDLHAAIRHALDMCSDELERAQLAIDVELRATAPWVRGDGTRLRQVFWNLLTNAIRYTASGGAVRVSSYDRAGTVCVDVTDTGRGIEPADLERVFEPFEQAVREVRNAGLGLGLAICRGLVRAHGGSIRAASIGRGQGTTFTVELPTTDPPVREPETRRTPPPAHDGLRILLVEDNEDTAEALAMLLRANGYHVGVAHSAEAARSADGEERFDLLLSDVQLPDGNGLELLRELRERHPVPAIAMSGFGTESDMQRSREAGFAKHLVKPVAIDRVLEAIEEVAGRDPADRPH